MGRRGRISVTHCDSGRGEVSPLLCHTVCNFWRLFTLCVSLFLRAKMWHISRFHDQPQNASSCLWRTVRYWWPHTACQTSLNCSQETVRADGCSSGVLKFYTTNFRKFSAELFRKSTVIGFECARLDTGHHSHTQMGLMERRLPPQR